VSRRVLQLGAALILVAALASLAATPRPVASLPWVFQAVAGATLVLWLSSGWGERVARRVTPRRQVFAVLAVGGIVFLIVLTGTRWPGYKLSYLSPLYAALPSWRSLPAAFFSTGISPNQAGATLAIFVAYALAVAVSPRAAHPSRLLRTGAGALAVAGGIVVFVTGSRASIAAIATSLVLVLVLRNRQWLWLPGAAAGVILSMLVLEPGMVTDLVNPVLREEALATKVVARLDIWTSALRGIQDHPYTGIGFGALDDVLPIRYPYETVGLSYTVTHAHNVFLDFALTLGLPGFAGFMLLLIGAGGVAHSGIRKSKSTARNEENGSAYLAITGSLAAITVLVVFGLSDSLSLSTISGILLWPWPVLLVLISYYMSNDRP
jgi:putative inorganic carbon (HCO3(-)) transporter